MRFAIAHGRILFGERSDGDLKLPTDMFTGDMHFHGHPPKCWNFPVYSTASRLPSSGKISARSHPRLPQDKIARRTSRAGF
jgi:hypothetical protein